MDNLLDVFENDTGVNPQGLAVMDEAGALTYGQLDILTAQFASQLLSQAPGFAAVYVTRTKNILVGALAAMKAGFAYMPVDDQYPLQRIAYMLKDAACGVILTERLLWEEKHPDDFSGTVIFLDESPVCSPDCVNWQVLHEIAAARQEGDNAILLYTSGTTGNPKGVVHTHDSLTAIVKTIQCGTIPVAHGSRVAVFGGFTFIASAHFLFAPLYYGGTACIVWDELRRDMDKLYRYLKKNGITHTFLPPSLGTVMAERYDLRGIQLMFAGEKLRPFTPLYPVSLFNAYGSTEGVIVACHNVTATDGDIPIGKPCQGIEIRLVDENGSEVAANEIGELWYSGSIQAKEYWHLPEQTSEKWTVSDGKRWFHTGDRMRLNENGELIYVGRGDDMVKLHGFRVELSEVENRIVTLGGKNFACAVRNIRGTDKLCCFYEKGKDFPLETIRENAPKVLAHYMVPDIWVAIEILPRNPNGKIVRRFLPTPEPEQKAYVAPATDVEAMVVKHIEELLHVAQVGMGDCFVDLGGDSLKAMMLSSRLKQRGIVLASTEILRAKSISELCRAVQVRYEEIWEAEEWDALQAQYRQRNLSIQKVMPLSKEQEIQLMQHILYPDNPESISFYAFLIDCLPAEETLRQALDSVSSRFECLRAAIVYREVSAIQQVITDRTLPIIVLDAKNAEEAGKLTSRFYLENTPFSYDLQYDAQLRLCCIRMENGQSLLLFAVQKFLLGEARLRWYFSEILKALHSAYPASQELPEWVELLSMGAAEEDAELVQREADGQYLKELLEHSAAANNQMQPPENPIFTYSKLETGKKMIFVHTANTGSEAYYSLAKHISSQVSFGVVEQYNIYHPDNAVYGLKNIARKYLEFVKAYQPSGPYILGGWCYGGMIAYEMAALLEAEGQTVELVVMLDSQAVTDEKLRAIARENHKSVGRSYFETCPLFADMRTKGMLERLIDNYRHVAYDVVEYTPSRYRGRVLYFKPEVIPAGSVGVALQYQNAIAQKEAGGYEKFVDAVNLTIVKTPHEHDLMMDEESLARIVPHLQKMISL